MPATNMAERPSAWNRRTQGPTVSALMIAQSNGTRRIFGQSTNTFGLDQGHPPIIGDWHEYCSLKQ